MSSVAVLVSGTALAQVLPVLLMPVISRLFNPEQFGVLGVFTAFIGMSATIVGLSFPLAIVSDVPRRTSAQLTVLSLIVALPMASVSVVVLYLLRRHGILGFQILPAVSLIFAWLVLVFFGVFIALRYWQVREQGYGKISVATVSQSIGRMGSQLIAGLLSLGGVGLIAGEVVSRLMGVSTLARASWTDITGLVEESAPRDYFRVASEFRKFPLLSTPSSLINSLSLELPVPLLTAAYSVVLSGQFSMAYRSLAIPIAVVGAAVADVFHGQLARTAGVSMAKTRLLFWQVAAGLFSIGILPSLVVLFWGAEIFSLVFGSQWRQAGEIASAIIPWLLASFVVSPLSRVVLVFKGQGLKLVYDIIAIVGVLGAIWFGQRRGWSMVETSWLLSITQFLAYAVYLYLLWCVVRSHESGTAETKPESR